MARNYLTPFRRSSMSGPSSGSGSLGSFGGTSLFDLHRQMNRLFDDLVGQGTDRSMGEQSFSAPALEVHQTDDALEISAELPGVKQDDIELTVEDGVLTLRGEKRSTRTDQERGYSERSYGRFERSITLPASVDEDKCSANFRDGVLTITLPKSAERQRGKRIPLGGGGDRNRGADNDSQAAPRQQAAQESARSDERRDDQEH
jgi:HSP20 family protein